MPTSETAAVQVTTLSDSIRLMTLDMPGKGANVLSAEMFDQLDEAISPLLSQEGIKGLILYSAKPKIFVAGADLNAIVAGLDWPDKKIIAFCERGREVMAKFNSAPFVTVAAIHGACVGGGFELALWCDRRIATDDRRTIIGLPEVKLGLIPGWAGTVRIGRMADIEAQLDLVTSARLLSAGEAQSMGLVDKVSTPDELIAKSVELIESEFAAKSYLERRSQLDQPLAPVDVESLTRKFSETITARANAIYPVAPLIALEHMLRAATMPMAEACHSESLAFAEAWGSEPSYGLLHNFFLGEHNRRNPGWKGETTGQRNVDKIGVVGAGLMGAAIVSNNLQRRKSVVLFDSNRQQATEVARRFTDDKQTVTVADSLAGFSEAELVIETVTESLQVKLAVLAELEGSVSATCIIATNTSAIPIADLSVALNSPERFCGIHFCHPELMSLVEIIAAESTDDATIASALGYVRSLGKMAMVVKDHAGFAVNRLLATLLDGAFRLLAAGVAVTRIDQAMREFGFRGGPFEIVDVIGADTCVNAGRAMWDGGLRCMTVSPILPRLVKLGRLGQKSGVGFYRYEANNPAPLVDAAVEAIVAPYQSPGRADLSDEEIAMQILAPMVMEARKMLDEGIVQDPRDIDIATIHGFTFPAHRGGLLFWADRVGIEPINECLQQMAQDSDRYKPSTQ